MDKKFLARKLVMVPMLSLIMFVSQMNPAFAFTNEELMDLLQESPEIFVETYDNEEVPSQELSDVIVPTEPDITEEKPVYEQINDTLNKPLSGPPEKLEDYDNWMGLYLTHQLSNFPEMRTKLEEIFPTDQRFGEKIGMLYPDGPGTCYWGALQSNELYKEILKPEIQQQMKEAASGTFTLFLRKSA